ncbi:SGNH/GDSL hydrolase family protein [Parasediminibacterium sp. JCM 36343]|uniref:SGNH/GDSL hydrolase family protein n=1 Tax=Parasediminibacterium sp. JCM 36343 TaxID=3374279 RepID=UPI00397C53DB
MKKSLVLALMFVAIFNTCSFAQTSTGKFIAANNKWLSYMGRVGTNDSCAEFYWTGTSVSISTKGTSTISAILEDEKGNNYYYVIVDGDSSTARKIKVDKEKKLYTLATNLDKKKHKVELFKVTNTDFITTRFYGFVLDSLAKILKPAKKPKRKIEFFGNSITCGHGVEVPSDSTDNGRPEYFNNYKTYAAITARHFNAQYHCTAKSGIGVTISWFPEVMPDIYDRLNPKDSTSKWDFAKYTPEIVVINLFQNDSWLVNMPTHPQFKARFGTEKPSEEFIINAYANFIKSIRGKYPKATILCCLGNMDATREGSKWPSYIDTAVASLKDNKLFTHFFPFKKTSGHPRVQEQEAMAEDLIGFIEKGKYWK